MIATLALAEKANASTYFLFLFEKTQILPREARYVRDINLRNNWGGVGRLGEN